MAAPSRWNLLRGRRVHSPVVGDEAVEGVEVRLEFVYDDASSFWEFRD